MFLRTAVGNAQPLQNVTCLKTPIVYSAELQFTQEFFLGGGGMFGLLQALVGEGLPGSTPCVAVGNALLQGPVVLHFPQALVNRIKQKALTGDQGVVQLCVDMYR